MKYEFEQFPVIVLLHKGEYVLTREAVIKYMQGLDKPPEGGVE